MRGLANIETYPSHVGTLPHTIAPLDHITVSGRDSSEVAPAYLCKFQYVARARVEEVASVQT